MSDALPPQPPQPPAPPAPPQPPPGRVRGVAEIALIFAGLVAPVALAALALFAASVLRLNGRPLLAVVLVAELTLGGLCLVLLGRRRARWFAVPCALVSAFGVFVCCSCWSMNPWH